MILTIVSLLLLFLPGYALLSLAIIHERTNFSGFERFIYGSIFWIFCVVTSVLVARILFPALVGYIILFDYLFGLTLTGLWFFREVFPKLSVWQAFDQGEQVKKAIPWRNLLFLIPIIGFIGIITLYTPLILNYDAVAVYLLQAREIIESPAIITGTWPTFEDSFPVMPVLYAWIMPLSLNPIYRLIPLILFLITALVIYKITKEQFPNNSPIWHITIISFLSGLAPFYFLQKSSLFLDLGLVLFSTTAIYLLLNIMENRSTRMLYLFLGMNLALLMLCKELGIFYAWFIIVILISTTLKPRLQRMFWMISTIGLLFAPFIAYAYGFGLLFTNYSLVELAPVGIFRLVILISFIVIFLMIFLKATSFKPSLTPSGSFFLLIPLFIPAVFFIHNYLIIGTPWGTLLDPYIQILYEMGIHFPTQGVIEISYLHLPDLFLSTLLLAAYLIPVLAFFYFAFKSDNNDNQNRFTIIITAWFTFSILLFYFTAYGDISGSNARRLLLFTPTMAIMVGFSTTKLLNNSSWPSWSYSVIFSLVASFVLFYVWCIKLPFSEWWLIKFESLSREMNVASLIDLLVYSLPWIVIGLLIFLKKNDYYRPKISSKKTSSTFMISLIISSIIVPSGLLVSASLHPISWDPAFYDQADSVKPHMDHWYIPVIDYYRVGINDSYVTIGFGVTPFEYFLSRDFIDLNHPRNWIIHSPLILPISTDDLLDYLRNLNVRYFLIPQEGHFSRERYEAALVNSTLFQLIANSTVFSSFGQQFQFQQLEALGPFELYALTSPSPFWMVFAVVPPFVHHPEELREKPLCGMPTCVLC